MVLQTTYQEKATQTENKDEDTIEQLLKAITTLCTKVDSMDNEIQKLKTNEDNLSTCYIYYFIILTILICTT